MSKIWVALLSLGFVNFSSASNLDSSSSSGELSLSYPDLKPAYNAYPMYTVLAVTSTGLNQVPLTPTYTYNPWSFYSNQEQEVIKPNDQQQNLDICVAAGKVAGISAKNMKLTYSAKDLVPQAVRQKAMPLEPGPLLHYPHFSLDTALGSLLRSNKYYFGVGGFIKEPTGSSNLEITVTCENSSGQSLKQASTQIKTFIQEPVVYEIKSRTAKFDDSVVNPDPSNPLGVISKNPKTGDLIINSPLTINLKVNQEVTMAPLLSPEIWGQCSFSLEPSSQLPSGIVFDSNGSITGTPTVVGEQKQLNVLMACNINTNYYAPESINSDYPAVPSDFYHFYHIPLGVSLKLIVGE